MSYSAFSQEFLLVGLLGRIGVPLTMEPGLSLRMHAAPATPSRGSYREAETRSYVAEGHQRKH